MDGEAASRRGGRLLPLALVLLAAVPYLGTLGFGFALDDRAEIVENAHVRSLANVREILLSPLLAGHGLEGVRLYRPLTTLTYAVDQAISGGHPGWFHAVNVLLHVAVSLLAWAVLRGWFADRLTPFLGAALFAVHPIHVEAVANVSGRKELLATLFCLATLLAFRRWRESGGAWLALAGATFVAGLASKETAVVAPALLVLEEWLLPTRGDAGASFRSRVLLPGALFAGLFAAYLAVRAGVLEGLLPGRASVLDNPLAHVGPVDRLLSALVVVARGLRLQLVPFDQSPDYSLAAIPVVTSPASPAFVLAAGALVAIGLAVLALRAERGLVVAAAFYPLALAPAANVLLPIGTTFGERLLYLPSVATCAVLGWVAARGVRSRRQVAVVVLGLVGAAAIGRTVAYASTWRNDETLFVAAREVMPSSAKVRYNVGAILAGRGETAAAMREYGAALAIHPDYPEALANRGNLRLSLGDRSGALDDLSAAIRISPRDARALNSRGLLHRLEGRLDLAIGDLDAAIAVDPGYGEALVNRGIARQLRGDLPGARRDFRAALERMPPDWRHRALAESLWSGTAP